MGLREALVRTLAAELHGCTPNAVQQRNFADSDATGDATIAQPMALRPRVPCATVDATRAQLPGCTAVAANIESRPRVATTQRRLRRPYRLTPEQADRCHARAWDDAACARFAARVSRLLRLGITAGDADDLAERLHLRDLAGDDRVTCAGECAHYGPGRCGNQRGAGLHSAAVGGNFAAMLQRCAGFKA